MYAGVGHEGPAVVPADGTAQDTSQADALQQRLAAAEEDRDKAKKQLNRLCSSQICCAVLYCQKAAGGWAVAISLLTAGQAIDCLGSQPRRLHFALFCSSLSCFAFFFFALIC